MWNNHVSSLGLSNCTELDRLVILDNNFKSLDLSNIKKKMADQFIIQGNPGENGKFVIIEPFDADGQPINVPERTEWDYDSGRVVVEYVKAN